MEQKRMQELKKKIDHAKLVSFDLYDTLIFRKHGQPQEVFRLLGCLMQQPGFEKERVRMQRRAYRIVQKAFGYPHPTLHEIYAYGAAGGNGLCMRRMYADSSSLHSRLRSYEELERRLEQQEAFPNLAMRQAFDYAVWSGRRVVVTTDMYLEKETIQNILHACGYEKWNRLYLSSDLKKTKYDGSMYQYLIEQEDLSPAEILQIGDDRHSDVDMARRFGIRTFYYSKEEEKAVDFADSLFRQDARRVFHSNCRKEDRQLNRDDAFWYQTGWQIGGALYTGLCTWIQKKAKGRKLYGLSRDGYPLTKILEKSGAGNCSYIRTSRRALLLPAINRLGERELALLPPYSCGQTVGEVLQYLRFTKITEQALAQYGFSGYGDVIRTKGDIARMKNVYAGHADIVLERCARERSALAQYFRAQGLFDGPVLFFDSGWNGTSQYLIERIYKLLGIETEIAFLYVGIRRNARSAQQLRHSCYHAFLNEYLPPKQLDAVLEGAAVLELFFSEDAPALWYYGEQGPVFEPELAAQRRYMEQGPVFEPELAAQWRYGEQGPVFELELAAGRKQEKEKQDRGKRAGSVRMSQEKSPYTTWITQGIFDAVCQSSRQMKEPWTAGLERYAVYRIAQLVTRPTSVQAQKIGNLQSTDSLSACRGMKKYIARIPVRLLCQNPLLDIFWERGVYRHPENCLCVKCYVFLRQRAAHWKNR